MIDIETTILLARFWGSLFIILGLLSIISGFMKRVIKYTEDRTITISTGYITFLLGLITVVMHNLWVWDWRLSITILGWATLLKGIGKIGFPEHVHKQAQRFKKANWFWSLIIFLIGVFFFYMSFR
jgi:uncharacterized membrane protein HdeD (DUF308 family)